MISIIPSIEIIEEEINTPNIFREVAWDFKKNIPILKNSEFLIVEGNEALKVWIHKALLTKRFKHEIYSWDFGSELETLVNKEFTKDVVRLEAERFISEALLINEYIISIKDVEVDFNDDVLNVKFNAETIYGEVVLNV